MVSVTAGLVRSAAALVAAALGTLGCAGPGASGDEGSAAAAASVAAFRCPVTAGSEPPSGEALGRRLQVVTTVAPITSIVANVAGDRADVRGVIPEGQDSHTYEPKPSVAAQLSRADVVFLNGLRLEDPTKNLAKQNLPKGGEIVELGSQTITPDQYIYDFSFPRSVGKPNPHLWTNPPMAACFAQVAAAALAKADPANAAYFRSNAEKFVAKIDELDRLMRDATASMPAANRKLLTYHDAYAYFAAHYGWRVVGAVQVSSFEDPTPKEVAALIKQVRAERIPAIFGSEVFPSAVLAQIAKEAGVRYVDKLRDDDLPGAPGDPDHSYLGLMKFDFVTMVSNLGGDASKLQAFDPSDVVHDNAAYPQ
jgi:ABC-type Zn uptake system ZnuABC Zn-binding protein ZnuA